MAEIISGIELVKREGVEPEITKDKWKQQFNLHFKLEPTFLPGWKQPLLPGNPRLDIKPVARSTQKIFALDIETTGIEPHNSRIIVVGVKDLRDPNSPIIQFHSIDEEELMKEFVKWFKSVLPEGIVGWGLGFDTKHIFFKLCFYRLELKEWESLKFFDLMDLFRKGTEANIFTLQKANSLNDVASSLFGRKKLLTNKEFMNAVKRKDFDLILNHNANDVEIISFLWQLVQFVFGRIPALVGLMSSHTSSNLEVKAMIEQQCKECLSKFTVEPGKEFEVCPICKTLMI
jgi:DNA polymerase elongation subunit (family B)